MNFSKLVEIDKVDYFGVPYKTKVLSEPQKKTWQQLKSSFNRMSQEQIEWAKKVYTPGNHQPINEEKVNNYFNQLLEP